MEQLIIENITDDKGKVRRGVWLQDGNTLRLFIEPPTKAEAEAQQADLATAQAENARLRKALETIKSHWTADFTDLTATALTEQLLAIVEGVHVVAAIALQPASKESQS